MACQHNWNSTCIHGWSCDWCDCESELTPEDPQ